jgi:putative FmdB family regulatory protein
MPTYPYRCLDCRRRFEVFLTYAEYGAKPVTCTHCGSQNVQRRIVRVRVAKSAESRMDDLTDPSGLEGLEDDPRALGQMLRKMGNEAGEDMGPEFNEVLDRLESGQSPEEIEESLPGLNNPGDEAPYGGGLEDGDF